VAVGGCATGFGFSAGNFALGKLAADQSLVETFAESPAISNSGLLSVVSITSGLSTPSSVSDVFNVIKDSVVSISVLVQKTGYFNQVQTGQGAGSGVVFQEDAEYIYIVTNYHVINQATKCTISFDDKIQVAAGFIGAYPNADIAVIKVRKSDLNAAGVKDYKIATFANSDSVHVGDMVIAVGNANGGGKSATFGIISVVGRQITDDAGQILNFLQTDAAINPGNSGGALVNINGEVIGINTAKLVSNGIEGIGYAIPSSEAVSLVGQIMSASSDSGAKPALGVLTIDITQAIKNQFGFPVTGVYVDSVTQGSTADTIGIKSGDIITAFNGDSVATGKQLTSDIVKTKVGDTVTVTVIRLSRANNSFQTLTLSGTMQQATSGTNF